MSKPNWMEKSRRSSRLHGSAGVERAVVCSIATKPSQFESILAWSKTIASKRIVPLASVHPRDPEALDKVSRAAKEGLKGIKLHPYYQGFDLDEELLFPLYHRLAELGLILVCHTGFDIAFERIRRADPKRILNVHRRVPDLKFVSRTHLGAWEDWDDVRSLLLGKPIYMEISYSLEFLSPEKARALLMDHPAEYLLFGTDSPWGGSERGVAAFPRAGSGRGTGRGDPWRQCGSFVGA